MIPVTVFACNSVSRVVGLERWMGACSRAGTSEEGGV